jgi:hypothetical protein
VGHCGLHEAHEVGAREFYSGVEAAGADVDEILVAHRGIAENLDASLGSTTGTAPSTAAALDVGSSNSSRADHPAAVPPGDEPNQR